MKLLLLFILASCSTATVQKTEPVAQEIVTQEVVTVKPVVRDNIVDVIKYTNFTEKQVLKTELALDKITEVVNGQCFKNFLENTDRPITKTNGKTSQEVVEHLRSTKVNIELIWYYKKWSKVHGYTKPGVKWIKLNAKYHTGTTICAEASNIYHESSHKIGYGHSYKSHKNRQYSVPYSINAGFKECCI